MIKIWAKIIKENKIIKQTVFTKDEPLDWGKIPSYVFDIAHSLDMPSPVILKSHVINYAKFNHLKFIPSDFLEEVDFDKFVIENIADS